MILFLNLVRLYIIVRAFIITPPELSQFCMLWRTILNRTSNLYVPASRGLHLAVVMGDELVLSDDSVSYAGWSLQVTHASQGDIPDEEIHPLSFFCPFLLLPFSGGFLDPFCVSCLP